MARRRARLLAISIVVCTVIGATIATGAPAPGDNFEVTADPSTTRGRSVGSVTRSVLSIRNISTASRVFSVVNSMVPGPCTQITMVRMGGSPSLTNITLAAGEQMQFVSSSTGSGTPVSLQCQWTVMELGPGTLFDTVHNYVAAPTDSWDLQPRSIKFRPTTPTGETQRAYIQNYTGATQSYDSVRLTQTSGSGSSLTFASGGPTTCIDGLGCSLSGGSVLANDVATVDVKCTLFDSTPVAGTLELIVGGNPIQSTTITCSVDTVSAPGIALSPTNLSLSNPTPTGSVLVTSTGSGGNAVTQASLFGDPDFVFAGGGPCTGVGTSTCNPMAGATTPVSLPISCTPNMTMTRIATLYVTPVMGFPQMSIVECVQSSTGPPMLRVSPLTISAGSRAIGSAYTETVTITNDGAGTLLAHVEPPPSADWTVSGCSAASPCQLDGNGSNTTVQVTFSPTAHDNRDSSMVVSANNNSMMETVFLQGSGEGAVLAVVEPTSLQSYTLELGTVGLNTPQSRTIKLRNNGNISTSATLTTTGGPPFMLSTGTVTVPANAGMDTPVTVTCQSPVPVEETRAITITKGAGTYATEPPGLFDGNGVATIAAHCKVVPTPVQILPDLDFQEVWKGTMPAPTINVTIRNPSTALTSANVTAVGLMGVTLGLTLGPLVPAGLPRVLNPGDEITTTLTLATSAEIDVGMALLAVTVDSVVLEQPISGKVVTPSARLAPATNLDLGTACIGSNVSGTVMLINDGTATLTIMRPTMDGAFTPRYVDPTTYAVDGTALLAPTRSAIASVHPSMSAGAGLLEGTLTWNVDGPGPFTIDVSLTYINAGAAVSPGALSFGPISLAQMSNRQTITLENCNAAPIDVAVEGLVSRAGNLSAWNVQPRTDMRTLAPEEKMTISVAFAPTQPGPHAADLRLVVDGEVRTIPLEGEGLGERIDRSSFYACSCQGGRAPLHGWPLVVAVVVICLPRRRRR